MLSATQSVKSVLSDASASSPPTKALAENSAHSQVLLNPDVLSIQGIDCAAVMSAARVLREQSKALIASLHRSLHRTLGDGDGVGPADVAGFGDWDAVAEGEAEGEANIFIDAEAEGEGDAEASGEGDSEIADATGEAEDEAAGVSTEESQRELSAFARSVFLLREQATLSPTELEPVISSAWNEPRSTNEQHMSPPDRSHWRAFPHSSKLQVSGELLAGVQRPGTLFVEQLA